MTRPTTRCTPSGQRANTRMKLSRYSASGTTHSSGTGARSVETCVVTPRSKLDGSAARITHRAIRLRGEAADGREDRSRQRAGGLVSALQPARRGRMIVEAHDQHEHDVHHHAAREDPLLLVRASTTARSGTGSRAGRAGCRRCWRRRGSTGRARPGGRSPRTTAGAAARSCSARRTARRPRRSAAPTRPKTG